MATELARLKAFPGRYRGASFAAEEDSVHRPSQIIGSREEAYTILVKRLTQEGPRRDETAAVARKDGRPDRRCPRSIGRNVRRRPGRAQRAKVEAPERDQERGRVAEVRVQGRDVEREAGDEGRDREEQVQAAAARLPRKVPGEEGHERSADIRRDRAELLVNGRLLRVDAPHNRWLRRRSSVS